VIGRSSDQLVSEKVVKKSRLFRDILMADMMESYYNLTLKTVFALNWFETRCQRSTLVYVDDDMVVNPANLIQFIDKTLILGLHCFAWYDARVDRDSKSKYKVPHDVYPDNHWPDYCNGAGVVMNRSTAGLLVKGALDDDINPKIWIDDVFVYGIVRQGIGLPITHVPAIRSYRYLFYDTANWFSVVYDTAIMTGAETWDRMTILWDKEKVMLDGGCRWINEGKRLVIVAFAVLISWNAFRYKHKFRRTSAIFNM
jgi:hypothetical protein